MIVYAAMWTDCIHESALSPLSLHATHSGAVEAIERHKAEMQHQYNHPFDGLDDDLAREHEKLVKDHPWSDENGDGFNRWEVVAFEVKQ